MPVTNRFPSDLIRTNKRNSFSKNVLSILAILWIISACTCAAFALNTFFLYWHFSMRYIFTFLHICFVSSLSAARKPEPMDAVNCKLQLLLLVLLFRHAQCSYRYRWINKPQTNWSSSPLSLSFSFSHKLTQHIQMRFHLHLRRWQTATHIGTKFTHTFQFDD